MSEHMDPGVALRLRRGKVTHQRIEGTHAKTGPVIPLTDERDWEYDTACGERVRSTITTKAGINVTCPDCQAATTEGVR